MSFEAESHNPGRRTRRLRLALGLLLGAGLLSCTTMLNGWQPTVFSGLPLSLLVILAALIAAVFAWREPRAKVVVSLCALALVIGAAASAFQRFTLTEAELVDDSVLPQQFRELVPLHQRLGKPQPGDWLTGHAEVGQTYDGYVRAWRATSDDQRRVIYVQALGEFIPTQRKIVDLATEFMGIYYQLPVRRCDDLPLSLIPEQATRRRDDGNTQVLTTYVLKNVLKPRLPHDAAALVAFTASDLWPGEGNRVYGQANPHERVGVYSVYCNGNPEESPESFRLALCRTLKTSTHETGHIFLMQHCIFYECGMCGANNRGEMDRHPLLFCPHCLAKLCYATGANPAKRCKELIAFAKAHGLSTEEASWQKSLAVLRRTRSMAGASGKPATANLASSFSFGGQLGRQES
jgi:archaemetzincin